MSKVKDYYDSKLKARHRLRRYETKHKKLSRAKNHNGYYVKNEKIHYHYEEYNCPERTFQYNKIDWDFYHETGEISYISETKVIPAHIGQRQIRDRVEPIFMVKRIERNAKPWRKIAARKFRRQNKFNEDTAYYKGSTYKRDFDVAWAIW